MVYFDCLAVFFVCIQQYCAQQYFLNDGLLLKFGFLSYIFRISVILSDKSVSELSILIICVDVV